MVVLQKYADSINAPYIESSAKTNSNVTSLFMSTAAEMKARFGHTLQPATETLIKFRVREQPYKFNLNCPGCAIL